ncbi:MAG: M81 family metallopeptidase [Acidiferrobacterales bacterium]|nr:M81 family metallopeptidase [Acidiferrobacterales bacterium]
MRVAIAGFALESVSFLPNETAKEDFEREARRGSDLIETLRDSASVAGGFIQVLEQAGAEIVPLVYTDCSAAGHAADETFEAYANEICDGIAAALPELDGVLLYLHGAMTTPTRTNPDLEIVQRVRQLIGPRMTLVVALDLHANVSLDMARYCNALFGFHYSPHTDMAETGARAASALIATLRGELTPTLTLIKVPVVLPSIFTATGLSPLKDIVTMGFTAEREHPSVIDVSIFCGFAYADVPHIGFSVAVVTDKDSASGERVAKTIATRIWQDRQALLHEELVLPLAAGVRKGLARAAGAKQPLVLLEHADRLNDSTWVLHELLRQQGRRVAVPYLWDPVAARACIAAGVGAEVSIEAGGRSSDRAGGPVRLDGKILYAGGKSYTGTGPMRRGRRIDLGPTALLDASGIVVSIVSHPTTAIDLDPFIQFALDVNDFGVIVLRSKTHFRAVYEPIASEILIIDSPDWGTAALATLPYEHVPAGVFPITVTGSEASSC